MKYNEIAEAVIVEAKAILAGGQSAGRSVDVSGMTEIGRAIVGQVNNFAASAATRAETVLRDGYRGFNPICAKLDIGSAEYAAASAAQDSISDFADTVGIEL